MRFLGYNSGRVRVFELQSDVWTQIGQDIFGEAKDDYSGSAVSISADGTRVAIGATHNSNFFCVSEVRKINFSF